MTLNAFGRAALALGLAATVAVSVDAQRNRNGNDRSNRDTDQSDRNADTETVNKTVALPARGTLKIHTFSGYVHVTGTNARDVTIKAVRRANRDVLDRVHLTIDTSGSTVTINANDRDRDRSRNDDHDNVVRTDFDIEMPASATLDINGFSSPVEVTDVTGELRLETFSGKITVVGARSAVDAHTFNGDVDVDLAGAGSSPSLNAHTFSGSIRAKVADSARAAVQFHTFSGDFESDLPVSMGSMRRSSVSGRVGGGSSSRSSSSSSDATLKFETFSGDVRVVK